MTIDEIEVERSSVRRWDVVAGGDCADWSTCLRLLESAVAASAADAKKMQPHLLLLQPTTKTILVDEFLDGSNKGYLTKCNDNNVGMKCQDIRCRTAIWEDSFRLALASSIETLLNKNNKNKHETSKSVEKEMVNEEKEMTIVDCSIIENNATFIKHDGLSEESTMDHITDMTKHGMEVSLFTNTAQSIIVEEFDNIPKLEKTMDVVLGPIINHLFAEPHSTPPPPLSASPYKRRRTNTNKEPLLNSSSERPIKEQIESRDDALCRRLHQSQHKVLSISVLFLSKTTNV
jgi:hypothetical protein